MTAWLTPPGDAVKAQRVRRLVRCLGLEAIDPTPTRRRAATAHRSSPSWLNAVAIDRVDHVWSAAITDIRLRQGFGYLVALIDWDSRYVFAWAVAGTWDSSVGLAALARAGRVTPPEIFKTDHGAQGTRQALTGRLVADGMHRRMDGRG
jgi:putative transposase